MDLRLLRYFVACVDNKTMHAAAEAVHVSQPALSKAVSSLEASLGVRLLDRRPRGVEPTRFGESLYRYAKLIESEVRHAVAEIDAMRGMTRGKIVIGVIPTMSAMMGEVARAIMELHPGLRLKLRIAFSAELTHALLEGELDLALLFVASETERLGLAFEALIRTGPRVAVRKGHPLAGRTNLKLSDLAPFSWLMPDYPPSHRQIIHQAFLDAGLTPPESAIEVSTIIFFNSLLQKTDLLTVVPATLFDAEQSSELVALDAEFAFPMEYVGLAYRENSTLLPGSRAVMDLIRLQCAGMPAYVGPIGDNGKLSKKA